MGFILPGKWENWKSEKGWWDWMRQLLMRRPDLAGLPEIPELPVGYTLRDGIHEDVPRLAVLLGAAFLDTAGTEWSPDQAYKALFADSTVQRTIVVEYKDLLVATASARLLPDLYPGSGYVHWVGSDPAHRGNRLGYIVTLASLHDFGARGCHNAVLETDDFRLPAIKTYLNLGFVPVYRDDTHGERWDRIREQLDHSSPVPGGKT